MTSHPATSESAPAQTVGKSLTEETRRKRRLIGSSLWPRARLLAEILYQQIDHDRLFTHAAALTYKTLFSLLPIFVLSLMVLSTISSTGGKNALDAAVKQMLFEQLRLNELPLTDDTGEELQNPDGSVIPLSSVIEPLIERAGSSIKNSATGWIAFAILLYGAISLMVVIESTFNDIYGGAKPRTWSRRIMLYWSVLTLGPIGVAISITLARSAMKAANVVAGHADFLTWFISFANVLSGLLVSWILILLMYRLIPRTHVNWRPALIGAFVGALLWELGKWGFSIYVTQSLRGNAYGSLALIPLFMLWIYLTWSAILIGLEISYMFQYWKMLKRRFFFMRQSDGVISDLRWIFPLGALLCRQFRAGKVTRDYEAADLLTLPNEVTCQLLEALENAGIVHNVHDRLGGNRGYALARPPESVTAYDLLVAARALCQVPPELAKEHATAAYPTSPALADLETLEDRWAKSQTLCALAGEENSKP